MASSIFPRFNPGARITFAGGATTAGGGKFPAALFTEPTGMKPASIASTTKHRNYSTIDGTAHNVANKKIDSMFFPSNKHYFWTNQTHKFTIWTYFLSLAMLRNCIFFSWALLFKRFWAFLRIRTECYNGIHYFYTKKNKIYHFSREFIKLILGTSLATAMTFRIS